MPCALHIRVRAFIGYRIRPCSKCHPFLFRGRRQKVVPPTLADAIKGSKFSQERGWVFVRNVTGITYLSNLNEFSAKVSTFWSS